MKKLVKPQINDLENLDSVNALDEGSCITINICCNQLCKNNNFYADDDKDDILF
jgi:hypothetical protein